MKEIISVVVGEGTEWELPGLLTIPEDAGGKVPAVVLVHGSGANDMDLTIHGNKPFRDIAEYLASQGIAVIRYDKRTLVHLSKIMENFSDFTVQEEYTDDAVLAANILKNDDRIDSERIFIIGFSAGGALAPRIDATGGKFAGLIIMAGSPRRFADIWYDQAVNEISNNQHLFGSEATMAQLAQIDEWMDYFNRFINMTDEEAKQYTLAGASGYYYKDWDSFPMNEHLQSSEKPILIMHGDKDVQVFTDRDFGAYKTLLQDKDNVTFKLYPDLNHLFMTSTLGTAAEYAIPETVNSQVLQDIVNWIKAN